MQWLTKLKKAHYARIITIKNNTKYFLERYKIHEDKGKWRRKPPATISPNSPVQFGVEGKVSRNQNFFKKKNDSSKL